MKSLFGILLLTVSISASATDMLFCKLVEPGQTQKLTEKVSFRGSINDGFIQRNTKYEDKFKDFKYSFKVDAAVFYEGIYELELENIESGEVKKLKLEEGQKSIKEVTLKLDKASVFCKYGSILEILKLK